MFCRPGFSNLFRVWFGYLDLPSYRWWIWIRLGGLGFILWLGHLDTRTISQKSLTVWGLRPELYQWANNSLGFCFMWKNYFHRGKWAARSINTGIPGHGEHFFPPLEVPYQKYRSLRYRKIYSSDRPFILSNDLTKKKSFIMCYVLIDLNLIPRYVICYYCLCYLFHLLILHYLRFFYINCVYVLTSTNHTIIYSKISRFWIFADFVLYFLYIGMVNK